MLAYIIGLSEEREIKEQIIFDIRDRLYDSKVSIEDPIAFVEESHKTILQAKIEEAKAESDAKHSKQMQDAIDKAEERHRYEREVDKIGNAQKKIEAKEESFTSGQEDIIRKQARDIVKKTQGLL